MQTLSHSSIGIASLILQRAALSGSIRGIQSRGEGENSRPSSLFLLRHRYANEGYNYRKAFALDLPSTSTSEGHA